MRLCIPVLEDKGMDSRLSDHFGSTPFFIVFDTDTKSITHVTNSNQQHSHGQCHPISVLSSRRPDAVVCSGIGKGAIAGLNASGIKIYLGRGLTAKEVIDGFIAGELSELTPDKACSRHGCH